MFKIKVATSTKTDLVIKLKMLSQTLLRRLLLSQYSKRLLCRNIIAKGMKDTAKEVMTIGW